MNAVLRQLICGNRGYWYVSAGIAYAFFQDTSDAHRCAEQLRALVDGLQELGSQLTFLV